MKKDTEWLEKQINKTLNIDGGSGERIKGFNKGLEFSLDLIEELDQPELPVILQFVVDWYEKNKRDLTFGIYMVMKGIIKKRDSECSKIEDWFNHSIHNPVETVVLMKSGYTIEKEKMYVVKINDQGSWLYLKSMQLYKDVESRTDLNSNFEAWKEKAIKFTNKEQAEGIAKFFNGEVVEVSE